VGGVHDCAAATGDETSETSVTAVDLITVTMHVHSTHTHARSDVFVHWNWNRNYVMWNRRGT